MEMDVISCAQCCSILAQHRPLAQDCCCFCLQLFPLLCAPAPAHAMLPTSALPSLPLYLPGTRQRPLSHQYHDCRRGFLCPKSWIRMQTQVRTNLHAVATKQANESNSNLNTGTLQQTTGTDLQSLGTIFIF